MKNSHYFGTLIVASVCLGLQYGLLTGVGVLALALFLAGSIQRAAIWHKGERDIILHKDAPRPT